MTMHLARVNARSMALSPTPFPAATDLIVSTTSSELSPAKDADALTIREEMFGGRMPRSSERSRWVYLPPLLHLGACLVSMIGYVIPKLQFLGIVWVFVMLSDLPVSAIAYALAWNHGVIAGIWVVVAGTLWWYLLGRGVETLIGRRRAKIQGT